MRECSSLKAAYLYATTPHMFAGATEDAFARVRDQASRTLLAAHPLSLSLCLAVFPCLDLLCFGYRSGVHDSA